MNLTIKNQNPPSGYPLCTSSTCNLRNQCLRARVAEKQLQLSPITIQINSLYPKYEEGYECTFYRSTTPARYARGFRKALNSLSKTNYTECIKELIAHTSRSQFYRLRSGEIPISPETQIQLLKILQYYGYKGNEPFDSYEYRFIWE